MKAWVQILFYGPYPVYKGLVPSRQKHTKPETFLGLGIYKTIRDLTWEKLRFIMPDDHMHHKKNRRYDLPYKDVKSILLNLIMIPLTKIPAVRKEITKNMNEAMIKPCQKIIQKR